ncbi:lysozyme inhibitor LprI family protein [Sphingosinicella terrae]|uniref:lysozyme inhibitor LprI family protein n=1 Tax=Sphingosinicella terrae TaxID=2172047 RepID=UPI000E0DA9C3|nr:lysozyme inhibitor LprI family protein [Sphingosinicella terrae]
MVRTMISMLRGRHLLAATLLAAPAAAAVPDYAAFIIPDGASDRVISVEHFACMADRGYIEAGSHECVEAELARLQPRLDAAAAAAGRGLAEAQAEWVATRWVRCDAEAALESETMAPLVRDGCRLDETVRRLLWLESLAPARS